MHHTITHWHGMTLHDLPIMGPVGAVVAALVVVALVMYVRESTRAGAAADMGVDQ